MSELKLKSCPWCNGNKITIEWEPCDTLSYHDTNRRWFAECCKCSCQGPFCQKENEVIRAWNTRHDSCAELVEDLVSALKLAQRDFRRRFSTVAGELTTLPTPYDAALTNHMKGGNEKE